MANFVVGMTIFVLAVQYDQSFVLQTLLMI